MLVSLGLLVLRVVVGLLFVGHGAQKLFGWFGGHGLKGTTAWIGSMGLRPAGLWALLAGLSEFGGGVLLALGLLNPLGSLGIIASMLMAIVQVHWSKGIWVTNGGVEYPLVNITAALAIALAGPGAYSLDAILGIRIPELAVLIVGLVLIVVGVLAGKAIQSAQSARQTAAER